MRIVHTADWHMGLRLGFVDRTDDLTQAIGQVADVCRAEAADVLLVCGDLFDGTTRTDVVRGWTGVLTQTFRPFLAGGGTVVALAGNHDNENLTQILRDAMALADPAVGKAGDRLRPGRLYLFGGPTFFRLAGRDGAQVQFVIMPSPTVARYGLGDTPVSPEDRDRTLRTAFRQVLAEMPSKPGYDPTLPTVLAAHILTGGAEVRAGRMLTEAEGGVMVDDADLPTAYAYVALGDVHRPQSLMDLPHVRYSGSIDRMDLGEAGEEKGVVVVDVGPAGLAGDPRVVPLSATPIYHVLIDDPATQLPTLADAHPDRETALVKVTVRYRADRDNLVDLQAAIEGAFPRCYARDFQETSDPAATGGGPGDRDPARGMADTVRDYLAEQMAADDLDRADILALADELLAGTE